VRLATFPPDVKTASSFQLSSKWQAMNMKPEVGRSSEIASLERGEHKRLAGAESHHVR